jgi:hypothetical protein
MMSAALTAAFLSTSTTFAAIINVPGDFPTIQAAIGAAAAGDEVVVAPGTYVENINMLGKAITVRSTDPGDAGVVLSTIIDGGGATAVTCNSGEDLDTVLAGFVITGNFVIGAGPGMFNDNTSPTVLNCSFIGFHNIAGIGGGMRNEGGSPAVVNSSFIGNTAEVGGTGFGGGMYNLNANPTVLNCSFVGNMVGFDLPNASGFGGGMYNEDSKPIVVNTLFSQNKTLGPSGEGGGMYNLNSNPTLTTCSFVANTAGGNAGTSGAGMYNDGSSPVLTNCSFDTNSGTINGAGMYNTNASDPSLTFCSFIGNAASVGGGMANDGGSPTLNLCSFIVNTAAAGGGMASAAADLPNVMNTGFCGNTGGAINGPYFDGGGNSLDYCWTPQFSNPCPPDITGDGMVNIDDLFEVLNNWGPCP